MTGERERKGGSGGRPGCGCEGIVYGGRIEWHKIRDTSGLKHRWSSPSLAGRFWEHRQTRRAVNCGEVRGRTPMNRGHARYHAETWASSQHPGTKRGGMAREETRNSGEPVRWRADSFPVQNAVMDEEVAAGGRINDVMRSCLLPFMFRHGAPQFPCSLGPELRL